MPLLFYLLISTAFSEKNPSIEELLQQNRLEETIWQCERQLLTQKNQIHCAWAYLKTDKNHSGEILIKKIEKNDVLHAKLLTAYKMIKRTPTQAKTLLDELEQNYRHRSLEIKEVLAEYYDYQAQVETASFIHKQILAQNPHKTQSHWSLAKYYLIKKEDHRASFHLRETVSKWPNFFQAKIELAKILLSQNNLKEGGQYLSEAYQLNKGHSETLILLSELFERKSKKEEALRFLKKAFLLEPTNEKIKTKLQKEYMNLAEELMNNKKYNEALSYLALAEKTGYSSNDFLKKRGLLYKHLGQFQKAAGDLLAYLSENESDSFVFQELGICYLNLKAYDKAMIAFEESIKRDPTNGLSVAWYAFTLEKEKKWPQARAAWKKAITLLKDPEEIKKAERRLATIENKEK